MVMATAIIPIAHTEFAPVITVATIAALLRKTNSSDSIHGLRQVYREVAAQAM
jgi:hypothetical protein